jgi:DNA-binding MarR family transcriptional regulator
VKDDSRRREKRGSERALVDMRPLSDLFSYRLRIAMNAVSSDLRVALEETGLRPALFALLAIVRSNPGIIQTAAGNALDIQRANLVPLLNELEKRKLVERRATRHDKRAYAL